jgi:hypothetical protein
MVNRADLLDGSRIQRLNEHVDRIAKQLEVVYQKSLRMDHLLEKFQETSTSENPQKELAIAKNLAKQTVKNQQRISEIQSSLARVKKVNWRYAAIIEGED